MKFNEDSRVKIPAILHCMRLGYEYISLKNSDILRDETSNIFINIFQKSVESINPGCNSQEVKKSLDEISLTLENEDLGKAFYEKITRKSGLRIINFDDFHQNTFTVVTELTYRNGDDEFRPDITLLINGMPLVFIEVKKPNNMVCNL
tara:strand:+ start:66 stop:509 length:444 start_codon:yes stop_codon:yes gene_type:complete